MKTLDMPRNLARIATMKRTQRNALRSRGPHERNLMIEIELIEIQ
jgi:hypothetical protein